MNQGREPTRQQEERALVRKLLDDLKTHVKGYQYEDLSSGVWLGRFTTYAIRHYARRMDLETLRSAYPGLSADEIAERRIERAKRLAGIEGALAATAHTAAVSATLGSGGAASPLTLPAYAAVFVTDMFFMTLIRLRLAYDMSVLYERDIDLDDPRDKLDLVRVAFGMKAIDEHLMGRTRRAIRPSKRRTEDVKRGSVRLTRRVFRSLGNRVFKRAAIKYTLPAASIPLAAVMNYRFAGETAELAQQVFRDKSVFRDAAKRIAQGGANDPLTILQTIWLVIRADSHASPEQSWLLEETLAAYDEAGAGEEAYAAFDSFGQVRDQDLLRRLSWAPTGLRQAAYNAAAMAAIADRNISRRERRLLKQLAAVCGLAFNLAELEDRMKGGTLRDTMANIG